MKKLWFVYTIFFIFLLINTSFGANAQIRADRSEVKINETFNLIVSVENAKGNVSLPKIDGIKVLSSSTNSSVRIINGKREDKTIYSFVVLPVKEGKVFIPSIEIKTNKGIIKTNSLEINVSKNETGIIGKDSFFAKAFISNSSPYVSEAIEFKIIVYSDETVLKIGFEEPDFNNFKAQRHEDKTYSKISGGKTYTVSEILYTLYPLNLSKGTIEPVRIEAQIGERRGRQNSPFFNDPFFSDPGFSSFQTSRKFISTNPISYEIKNLPKNNLNSFFTNITGKITASSKIDKNSLNLDDFINYKITIKGEGNLSEIKLPEIESNENFKVYPDNPKFELKKFLKGEKGEVVFNYAVVPSKPGEFEIPQLKFCYFDPEAENWVELELEKKSFSVIGEKNEAFEIDESKSLEKKEEKKIRKPVLKNDIIYLKEDQGSFFSSVPDYFLFLKLYFSFGFVFFMFFVVKKINPGSFVKKSKKLYLKELKKLQRKKSENKNLYKLRVVLNSFFVKTYGEPMEIFCSKTDDTELKEYLSELEFAEFSGENTKFDLEDLVLKGKKIIKRF